MTIIFTKKLMRGILLTSIFSICCVLKLFGQTNPSSKSLAEYLIDVSKVTSRNRSLWNSDLYGPILFVDPTDKGPVQQRKRFSWSVISGIRTFYWQASEGY